MKTITQDARPSGAIRLLVVAIMLANAPAAIVSLLMLLGVSGNPSLDSLLRATAVAGPWVIIFFALQRKLAGRRVPGDPYSVWCACILCNFVFTALGIYPYHLDLAGLDLASKGALASQGASIVLSLVGILVSRRHVGRSRPRESESPISSPAPAPPP